MPKQRTIVTALGRWEPALGARFRGFIFAAGNPELGEQGAAEIGSPNLRTVWEVNNLSLRFSTTVRYFVEPVELPLQVLETEIDLVVTVFAGSSPVDITTIPFLLPRQELTKEVTEEVLGPKTYVLETFTPIELSKAEPLSIQIQMNNELWRQVKKVKGDKHDAELHIENPILTTLLTQTT